MNFDKNPFGYSKLTSLDIIREIILKKVPPPPQLHYQIDEFKQEFQGCQIFPDLNEQDRQTGVRIFMNSDEIYKVTEIKRKRIKSQDPSRRFKQKWCECCSKRVIKHLCCHSHCKKPCQKQYKQERIRKRRKIQIGENPARQILEYKRGSRSLKTIRQDNSNINDNQDDQSMSNQNIKDQQGTNKRIKQNESYDDNYNQEKDNSNVSMENSSSSLINEQVVPKKQSQKIEITQENFYKQTQLQKQHYQPKNIILQKYRESQKFQLKQPQKQNIQKEQINEIQEQVDLAQAQIPQQIKKQQLMDQNEYQFEKQILNSHKDNQSNNKQQFNDIQ